MQDRPQAQRYRKLTGASPPDCPGLQPSAGGADHWTLRLAGKVVELGLAPARPMRRCASGSKKRPQAVAEAGMVHPKGKRRLRGPHHVLDLYAEPYDPQRPVVCFDVSETRPPLPPRPGLPRRQDYEYRRKGTRNLFLA